MFLLRKGTVDGGFRRGWEEGWGKIDSAGGRRFERCPLASRNATGSSPLLGASPFANFADASATFVSTATRPSRLTPHHVPPPSRSLPASICQSREHSLGSAVAS